MDRKFTFHKDVPGYVEPPAPPAPPKPDPQPLDPILKKSIEPVMACSRCSGSGCMLHEGFTTEHKDYPTYWEKCCHCDGAGWFLAPAFSELVKKVVGRKPRTLRSKRPEDSRAYFIWRLARFHGGKDVCLPMVAEMEISGDPYKDLLDEFSKLIAKACFGSSNVGAARWQQAMYGSHQFSDLPPYIDGPVHDGQKPLEEMLETI